MPQAEPAGQRPAATWHPRRLPLLGSAWERLGRSPAVLDCGGAGPATLAWISQLGGRYAVLDVAGSVWRGATEPGAILLQALSADAERFVRDPVDFVLLWDLLDYLDETRLPRLDGLLDRLLRGGGYLHALVTSSASQRPQEPVRWRMGEDGEAVEWSGGKAMGAAPRHSPWALRRGLPRLEIERTVLLQGGYQEYLFRRVRGPTEASA